MTLTSSTLQIRRHEYSGDMNIVILVIFVGIDTLPFYAIIMDVFYNTLSVRAYQLSETEKTGILGKNLHSGRADIHRSPRQVDFPALRESNVHSSPREQDNSPWRVPVKKS
ncbi:transmembrane protein, putative [Medicago truncatula]|uniref:Transmembrane protein, putative n=1 Tax=Medicago truncatula TaxID=3880 RepID=A0A072TIC8_MEDTR|nr:transmembrane protein, putative [Medicago truncatula]